MRRVGKSAVAPEIITSLRIEPEKTYWDGQRGEIAAPDNTTKPSKTTRKGHFGASNEKRQRGERLSELTQNGFIGIGVGLMKRIDPFQVFQEKQMPSFRQEHRSGFWTFSPSILAFDIGSLQKSFDADGIQATIRISKTIQQCINFTTLINYKNPNQNRFRYIRPYYTFTKIHSGQKCLR